MTSRLLPLFPLPLVLFPSAPLPLHIFEPRYRALLADVQRTDRRFGIVLTTAGPDRTIAPGTVGCVAEVREVQPLPDGRSNVLVEGCDRFAFDRLVTDVRPYHVAEVHDYADTPEPAAAAETVRLDDDVRTLFDRVARAARTIADDADPIPELPADPSLVAFRIASLVELDVAVRQSLLESRSVVGRLREMHALLASAAPAIEGRAETHARARLNGHGPH